LVEEETGGLSCAFSVAFVFRLLMAISIEQLVFMWIRRTGLRALWYSYRISVKEVRLYSASLAGNHGSHVLVGNSCSRFDGFSFSTAFGSLSKYVSVQVICRRPMWARGECLESQRPRLMKSNKAVQLSSKIAGDIGLITASGIARRVGGGDRTRGNGVITVHDG